MGILENAKIDLIKKKLNKSIGASSLAEIEVEGVKEYRDIPYQNRTEQARSSGWIFSSRRMLHLAPSCR